MTDLRDLRRRRSATWPFGISLNLLLVKGDGQASVATSRHVHILMMSDALTEGIVKQFREKCGVRRRERSRILGLPE